MGLGHMYIGEIGEGVEKVKASLVRCFSGSSQIGAAHSVVRSAIECLQPKVVFSVGFCGGLKKEETKLGDVVISSKLSTYGETKITYDREQWCGNTLNVSKNIGDLIRSAADGWQVPLSNPEALEVKVHRDAEVLTGLKLDSCPRRTEELLKQFPGAIAVEAEGQGDGHKCLENCGLCEGIFNIVSVNLEVNLGETYWGPKKYLKFTNCWFIIGFFFCFYRTAEVFALV